MILLSNFFLAIPIEELVKYGKQQEEDDIIQYNQPRSMLVTKESSNIYTLNSKYGKEKKFFIRSDQ